MSYLASYDAASDIWQALARGAYLGGGAEHIPRVWSGGGGEHGGEGEGEGEGEGGTGNEWTDPNYGGGGGGGGGGSGKEEDDMASAIGRIAELSLLGGGGINGMFPDEEDDMTMASAFADEQEWRVAL